MRIYCLLVLLIIFLYMTSKKQSTKALTVAFLCIFLISALRAETVGRDLDGYIEAYEQTKSVRFGNFDYIYFEKGYILLMQICQRLHMSNQMFIVLTSFLIIAPIYWLIRKYSGDYMMSTLIYVCYQMFEFDLTGIRQAIAMSLSLFAFMALVEKKKGWLIKFLLITVCATYFHTGAFCVFFALPFLYIKSTVVYTAVAAVASAGILMFRGTILSYIANYFDRNSMNMFASTYISGNLLFLIGVAILMVYLSYNMEMHKYEMDGSSDNRINEFTKIFILVIPFCLLFGEDTAVRSAMFMSQLIIIVLPESVRLFNERSQKIVRIGYSMFFVAFFALNTLLPNNFDIIPYVFYWNY